MEVKCGFFDKKKPRQRRSPHQQLQEIHSKLFGKTAGSVILLSASSLLGDRLMVGQVPLEHFV